MLGDLKYAIEQYYDKISMDVIHFLYIFENTSKRVVLRLFDNIFIFHMI